MNSKKNSAALKDFNRIAVQFCKYIDNLKGRRPKDFYERVQTILAKLLNTILVVEIDGYYFRIHDDKHEKYRINHSEWKKVFTKLNRILSKDLLKAVHYYNKLNDTDSAQKASMLGDDLADIYRDLKTGILAFKNCDKESKAIASFEWRFNYEIHWGEHLFRAMLTMQDLRYFILS